ncbi:hypothetical protein DKM44_14495 [Deinococcus irradiatisoli]|uniref:Uncharacterized protein n=1 Tax=Deinococcus irradiatisoli TaxID=2202254 RepID=A0A2Z3JSS3_9DEIO|nr:hypothetical protein [Deinococcus irradiatisoli]AWN24288.1 hypothetical protein DKM44_14495 [Deinococcus irradiatisoli]
MAEPPKVLSPREVADRWAAEAQQLPFEAPGKLQEAATRWLTFLTSALGVLGVGGIAFLPGKLAEITSPLRGWVMVLLLASVGLGLWARVLATLANQVTPARAYTDGPLLRKSTALAAEQAGRRLLQSQQVTTWAVACLMLAALLGVLFPATPAPEQPYRLVYQLNGPALCGQLRADAGGQLFIGATPLRSVTAMTPVARCPNVSAPPP